MHGLDDGMISEHACVKMSCFYSNHSAFLVELKQMRTSKKAKWPNSGQENNPNIFNFNQTLEPKHRIGLQNTDPIYEYQL